MLQLKRELEMQKKLENQVCLAKQKLKRAQKRSNLQNLLSSSYNNMHPSESANFSTEYSTSAPSFKKVQLEKELSVLEEEYNQVKTCLRIQEELGTEQ